MKRKVIKLNESDLQRMVRRIIKEEKKSLNELGDLTGMHDVFGDMNFSDLTDRDVEKIKRYVGRDMDKPSLGKFKTDDGDFEHGTFDHEPCEKCGGLGYHEFTGDECRWCHGTGGSQSSYLDESEEWIKDTIKRPGGLRKKMGSGKDEKIPSKKISDKLASLRKKDKNPDEKGIQGLSKDDLRTYRQINLAKTLKKY